MVSADLDLAGAGAGADADAEEDEDDDERDDDLGTERAEEEDRVIADGWPRLPRGLPSCVLTRALLL